jgi:hypothetical protein
MSDRAIRISSTGQFGVSASGDGTMFVADRNGLVWLTFSNARAFLDFVETVARAGTEFLDAEDRAFAAAMVVKEHLTPDDICGGGDFPPLARI